jgi:hypothetical protein
MTLIKAFLPSPPPSLQIYKELGFRGLYAGLGPTLARAFPANAAAMVTWELTARLLGVRRHELQV